MSTDEQKLYDPHIPPTPPPDPETDADTKPPHSDPPPYQSAPQTFPAQPASYQPVYATQAQQSTSNTIAVVNTAPTPVSTFTLQGSKPPNYLVLNIVTLLLCCWIFGLIGLIYSLQVDTEWGRGNQTGAHSASQTARNWAIAGIVTGTFITAACIMWVVISTTVNASKSNY